MDSLGVISAYRFISSTISGSLSSSGSMEQPQSTVFAPALLNVLLATIASRFEIS